MRKQPDYLYYSAIVFIIMILIASVFNTHTERNKSKSFYMEHLDITEIIHPIKPCKESKPYIEAKQRYDSENDKSNDVNSGNYGESGFNELVSHFSEQNESLHTDHDDHDNEEVVEYINMEKPCVEVISWSEEPESKDNVEESFYYISQEDRECLSYIISGEAGSESIDGKMAVAQCLLNAMRKDGLSAEEVRDKYQYAGWKTNLEEVDPENWQQVLDAIERVFDNGETVTDENILYFYAPKYCTSKWHESQKYVGTFGTQRFFAPNN